MGLVLPSSMPAASRAGTPAATQAPDSTLSEAEYVALLRRHDAEEADDWHNESQLYTNDLGMPSVQLAHRTQPGAEAGFGSSGSGGQQQRAGAAWLPVPLELSAAQPVMAMAAMLTQELRASLQQAHSMAAQLLQGRPSRSQQPLRALDVDISSSSAAGVGAIRMGSSEGMLIDLTVSSTSNSEVQEGPRMPSALFDSAIVPAVMRAATGGSSADGGALPTAGSSDGQLAVQLTRSVIESAMASRDAGDQAVLLDLTVDNIDLAVSRDRTAEDGATFNPPSWPRVGRHAEGLLRSLPLPRLTRQSRATPPLPCPASLPQEARRIMAAASSASAAGQEMSGWDRVELQVELLDTAKPASSWTCCWMGLGEFWKELA
jgi:hypothetical protein